MELWMDKLGKFPMWHSNEGWRARIVVIYPGGAGIILVIFTNSLRRALPWRVTEYQGTRTRVQKR